jgi:hypothetical protein
MGTAKTSVICAVWHGDPKRHELLRGHVENLARQTAPVEAIYVFDNGDLPPDGFAARAISATEPLTIYQAWNVALSLVQTSFVMNLNLDDRLAPDGVSVLEGHVEKGAVLAGGDWNVCYTQEETDAVGPCLPAETLPFSAPWPPEKGTRTRLGSGTGERRTYGPACMWRMSAHLKYPRYPWRFSDGTLIRAIGDGIWWGALNKHFPDKVMRVPMIIGNYHSHPADQAEFRLEAERDILGRNVSAL